jgi:hypothetical protein
LTAAPGARLPASVGGLLVFVLSSWRKCNAFIVIHKPLAQPALL